MAEVARVAQIEHGSPRLTVEMRHQIGTLGIDAEFQITKPWTLLFGPSGSGKSTILRAIAGLVQPDRGKLRYVLPNGQKFHEVTLVNTGVVSPLPPQACMIPLAPQSHSLFPHWSVRENLTMRRKRVTRSNAKAEEVLPLFRLEELRDKLPIALSGGEAQRVNLARAVLWTIPGGLLLLDEPFAGMDIRLRDEILCDMRAWLAKRDVWVLSVTHDVAEAFQLGAEVIKIANGKVIAQGPVDVVLAEERQRLLRQLQS